MTTKSDDRSITLRAFSVIDAVLQSERGLTLPEVLEAAKLHKPTAYRILGLLEQADVLARDLDGRHYIPGPALARMAFATFASGVQRSPRLALLRAVTEEVGEGCGLAVLDGIEARYVERSESRWPLRLNLPSDTRIPLHCTASGKLLLAYAATPVREQLIGRLTLARFTARTFVERAALERHLSAIRTEGCAQDDEEWLSGLTCLAVPVFGKNGRMIAALTVHAPTARSTAQALRSALPAARRAATLLTDTLFNN